MDPHEHDDERSQERARAEYVRAYERANRSAATFRDQRNTLAMELAALTGRTWREVLDQAGMSDVPDGVDDGQAALLDVNGAAGDEPTPREPGVETDEEQDWIGTGS